MALCPNGQESTIEWQYAGELEKQRIIGADNYTIKENIKQGQNNYQYWVDVKRKVVSGSSPGYYFDDVFRYLVYGPIQGIKYDDRPNARQRGYGTHPNSFIKTPTYDQLYAYLYARNYANHAIPMYLSSNAPPPDLNEIEIVGIYPRYGEDDTNNKDCTFTIYKNNIAVYERTNLTCPTVIHFCGDQCPPGTCQCDCGTEVCCYDTVTGKAVKSFRK